jgi:hypothetical protein
MDLPDDLNEICDCATAIWPKNWFENFGSSAFFHVAGLREYICELYGPKTPSTVAEILIKYKDNVPSLIKPQWVAKVSGTNLQDLDLEECLADGKFNNLTNTNIKNSYTGRPVTFPAAMLTYLAATLLSKEINDRNGYKNFQIRFAGYYIIGFGEIYPKLDSTQKTKLVEDTQQTLSTDYEFFNQMAKGQPVTKPCANRTVESLRRMTDKDGRFFPQLEVKSYQLRTDIGGIKTPAQIERTYLEFRV